jgi:hypothetical protein
MITLARKHRTPNQKLVDRNRIRLARGFGHSRDL